MLFANNNSFIFTFQFGWLLFFSYLIAVVRTSNTILNVLDFRGKAFSFSSLSIILAVKLS